MRSTNPRWLVFVALAGVLGLAQTASAQPPSPQGWSPQIFGLDLSGRVEVGSRFFIDAPAHGYRSKFEEYRDLPGGPFLGDLQLRLEQPNGLYSTDFAGSKWGQDDQEFTLGAGRLGLWEFRFDWDQMRHVYATNAKTFYNETAPGVFRLPSFAPRVAAPTAASIFTAGQFYNNAPELDEVSVRWDTARMSFRLTPTPEWELTAQYTRIDKDGRRPFSMVFGSSPGATTAEAFEPIEQQVHDFRVNARYATPVWQFQLGYTLSIFNNEIHSLIIENPFQSAFSATAAAAGQTSLPPDNMAHTINIAGGVNLPMHTRIAANLGYTLRLQNDPFLPHTISPLALSSFDAVNLALPRKSLDGKLGITIFNFDASTRPFDPLMLSLKYRLYDYDDKSPEITFPGNDVGDVGTVTNEARRSGGWSHTRHSAEIDARYQVVDMTAVSVGPWWERWMRSDRREVPETDEFGLKFAVDSTPVDWLTARVSYKPSFRRMNEYRTFAALERTVVEEDVATEIPANQSTLLRKFDEADRNRHQAMLQLLITPSDSFNATITGDYRNDEYPASHLGLRAGIGWSAGFDLGWQPFQNLSFTLGYVRDNNFQRWQQRFRTVTGTTVIDDPTFEWIAATDDTTDTVRFGVTLGIIPRVLEWTGGVNYQYAFGNYEQRNAVQPSPASGVANATSATAKKFPSFEDRLIRIETALSYHFLRAWTATFGYAFESFDKTDFRNDGLTPFPPFNRNSGTSGAPLFLGIGDQNYTAHILGVSLAYQFGK